MDILIDDYIMTGGVRMKSTNDQNFAKPIEDEDIFAIQEDDQPEGGISEPSGVELDEIFANDYSRSPERPSSPLLANNYSDAPQQPPPLTQAQLKVKQMKEKILSQVKTMNLKPRQIGTDFGEDGHINVMIEQKKLVSNSSSKAIFNKLFNQSAKAKDGKSPENQAKTWSAYKELTRKKICAQKRKVWDSFQVPADEFDDEEEIHEIADDTKDPSEKSDVEEAEDCDVDDKSEKEYDDDDIEEVADQDDESGDDEDKDMQEGDDNHQGIDDLEREEISDDD